MNKINNLLNKAEEYVIFILVLAMTSIIIWQVFNRFFLRQSLNWSEELARYLIIWVVFLAGSVGVKHKAHIGVMALVQVFPENLRYYIIKLSYLVSTIFFILIMSYGYKIVLVQKTFHQVSPAMRIPMYIPYLALPIGSLIIALRFFQFFLKKAE